MLVVFILEIHLLYSHPLYRIFPCKLFIFLALLPGIDRSNCTSFFSFNLLFYNCVAKNFCASYLPFLLLKFLLMTCAGSVDVLRGIIDLHCFSDIFCNDKFNSELDLFPVSTYFCRAS